MGDFFDDYPDSPGYKRDGTSKAAADKMAARVPTIRDRILDLLKRGNFTPDEAASRLGLSILAVRPRFSELSKLNKIERTGQTRLNASNINADVWRLI